MMDDTSRSILSKVDLLPYAAVLSISILSLMYMLHKYKSSKLNQPPGRSGYWSMIRETLDYAMTGRRGMPEKFFANRISCYSSEVFKTSLVGLGDTVVFCGPSGNKFLFTKENKYVTSWFPRYIKKVVEFPDPNSPDNCSTTEAAAKTINFIRHFVKPDALQNYIPIMDSSVKRHLEAVWAPYEEVPLLKKWTFGLSIRLLMSLEDRELVERQGRLFSLITAGFLSLPINLPGTAYNKAVQAGKKMREGLLVIRRKRKDEIVENKGATVDGNHKDLLSHMLLAEDEHGQLFVNEHEIGNVVITKIIASVETTSTVLAFVVKYLAESQTSTSRSSKIEIGSSKSPDELLNWKDIQKMRYSWMVACETMRLCPPAMGGFREAISDFTYSGYTISKGSKTHWTVHSTHKDPKYFPDPEKFDPSRFEGKGPAPFTFVPFGGGPRMCPGKEYARIQILVFMHNLVTKFRLKKAPTVDEKIVDNPMPIPTKGNLLPVRIQSHD